MIESTEEADELATHVSDYLETFYQLTALKVSAKATGAISFLIVGAIVLSLSLFVFFAILIGLGWWLGHRLHNMLAGLGIVLGICVAIILLVIFLSKSFLLPALRDSLIKKIYEQSDNQL